MPMQLIIIPVYIPSGVVNNSLKSSILLRCKLSSFAHRANPEVNPDDMCIA